MASLAVQWRTLPVIPDPEQLDFHLSRRLDYGLHGFDLLYSIHQ